jgi:hypothetical protein
MLPIHVPPFRLVFSTQDFTKLLKPAIAILRSRGIRIVIYLDDMLLMNTSKEGLEKDVSDVLNMFQSLGFLVNFKKSELQPTKSIEYLGLLLDSSSLSFSLPSDKLEDIRSRCQSALSQNLVSLKTLSSILGLLNWATRSVPYAQAHYRDLQRCAILASHSRQKRIPLTSKAKDELSWWVNEFASRNRKPFRLTEPDLTIFADASSTGWGPFPTTWKSEEVGAMRSLPATLTNWSSKEP